MIKVSSQSDEVVFTEAGLSCLIDRFIPPFTEMTVTISLPRKGGKEKKFTCKCAVIRCSRERNKEYRLLLYFLDIDERVTKELVPYSSILRF